LKHVPYWGAVTEHFYVAIWWSTMGIMFVHPVGSHVPRKRPLDGAVERDADVVQINLSAPRNWAAPQLQGDEDQLLASDMPVFVHAPYLINPASINETIRNQSRVCLEAESKAAAVVGAKGVVVHGGHPTGGGDVSDGVRGWVDVLTGADLPCRVLIENTAGGTNAPARHVDDIARLFDVLRGAGHDVGFVLDTCHGWAAGEDLVTMVERLRGIVGTIDLVHVNNSRDVAGSGRDRHANIADGMIPESLLVEVVLAADAPVVVETPGGAVKQKTDVSWLKQKLVN
jgi:deoxyribonuclease IV